MDFATDLLEDFAELCEEERLDGLGIRLDDFIDVGFETTFVEEPEKDFLEEYKDD